jgi:hypothetical protein
MLAHLQSSTLRLRASRFRRETVSTHNNGADDGIFLEILQAPSIGSLTRLFIVPVGHPQIFAASG